MKKLYFLAFLLLMTFSNAQIINFPDSAFKAKLLQANPSNTIAAIPSSIPINGAYFAYVTIDTNGNDEIEVSEAAVISRLQVPNSNITSLEGIQYFTDLSYLNCSFNQMTSLTLD